MQRVIRGTVVLAAAVLAAGSLQAQGGKKVSRPTGVTVTSNTTTLTASWNNVANAVSYTVNSRQGAIVTTLGSVAGSPWTGPLPPAGPYEFQVVAIGSGQKNTAASAWVAYTVPVAMPSPTTTPGIIVTEPRPGTGGTITPIVIPAGPAFLSAASSIPGQITVTWREVTGATHYRVVRRSDAPEAEKTISEQPTSGFFSEGGLFNFTDAPVDNRFNFTYRVFALFINATGGAITVSTPSPEATARSAVVVQPTGFRAAVMLTPTPGRVRVTLSWDPVPNAVQYSITGLGTISGDRVVTGTSTVYDNVPAGGTYRPCVGSIYPFSIGNPATAACIDVRLN